MENRRGSEIFLGVIGVATLVVAIIGATFAFFSASANSAENAVSVESASLDLNYVDNVGTNLKTHLIPAAEDIATYGALNQKTVGTAKNNQCIDDVGNEVCGVYVFTVTNPSTTTTQDISFSLNVVTNEFSNLKYKIYEGAVADLSNTSTAVVSATAFGAAESKTPLAALKRQLGTTAANNSVTFTMVIWIDEAGGDQTSADAGSSFAAGLTVTSGGGQGVTGVIAAAKSNG